MGHDAVFTLVPKEEAKDSFEARRLVALRIRSEIRAFLSPPYPKLEEISQDYYLACRTNYYSLP